jgi:hypothetical protein
MAPCGENPASLSGQSASYDLVAMAPCGENPASLSGQSASHDLVAMYCAVKIQQVYPGSLHPLSLYYQMDCYDRLTSLTINRKLGMIKLQRLRAVKIQRVYPGRLHHMIQLLCIER